MKFRKWEYYIQKPEYVQPSVSIHCDAHFMLIHLSVVAPDHEGRRLGCKSHQTCQVDRTASVDVQVRAPQNLRDGLWNKQKTPMQLFVMGALLTVLDDRHFIMYIDISLFIFLKHHLCFNKQNK
jgi:hypothetical protein